MLIYILVFYQVDGGVKELVDMLIDMVVFIIEVYFDKFMLVNNFVDVKQVFVEGKIVLLMGMENGVLIGDDLVNVVYFC